MLNSAAVSCCRDAKCCVECCRDTPNKKFGPTVDRKSIVTQGDNAVRDQAFDPNPINDRSTRIAAVNPRKFGEVNTQDRT